jgi:hypothetical protein
MPNVIAAPSASLPNNAHSYEGDSHMPILLWLLGVPFSLIIILMLLGGI